ncbi:MAG: peroxidase-related enzyme [Bacteroidetes bacterium]|jgi:uncharacterized peroxidase-related enzyme|nr:peroxidase-related enzyme [Bacteroidota bacterium]
MAWIETIDDADATGDLRALYDEIAETRGKLSNILAVHSLNPPALRAHLKLYDQLLFGRSNLRRAEREALATVVSAANDCDYCVRHHAEALHAYWKDDARVEQLIEDHRALDLPARMHAMLDYGAKLTQAPATVAEDDVQVLREAGFSDRDVLDINLITSYFNFVNRIAEGLGVAFTEEEATGYDY